MANATDKGKEKEYMPPPPPPNGKGKEKEVLLPPIPNSNDEEKDASLLAHLAQTNNNDFMPPLSPSQRAKEKRTYLPPPKWKGRYHGGKLYCNCNFEAKFLTCSRDVAHPHYLEKFVVCPKAKVNQCGFFIWEHDWDEATEWLKQNGPPPPAETPSSSQIRRNTLAYSPETPFTMAAKRKSPLMRGVHNENENEGPSSSIRQPVFRQVSDESESGDPSSSKRKSVSRQVSNEENGVPSGIPFYDLTGSGDEDEPSSSPSKKARKANRLSRPGRTFNDQMSATGGLPTPDTGKRNDNGGAIRLPIHSMSPSPTPRLHPAIRLEPATRLEPVTRPNPAINLNRERRSTLASDIIRLLRSEDVELKESTELMIRHEIELETDLHDAKVKRYEATVSRMSTRLDELEKMVVHLTGGTAANKAMEFSQ